MADRETDYYARFEGEHAAQLFRVRWVENPEVEYPGPFPRFEQLDRKKRWVENRDLIRTIGGSGGGNFDVWMVDAEDARKVAKRLGVKLDAPTAGYIGEVEESEDAR